MSRAGTPTPLSLWELYRRTFCRQALRKQFGWPHPVRVDDDGVARVIALPIDLGRFVDLSFGRLRHYVAADMIASLHFLRIIGEVAAECRRGGQVELLREEVGRFESMVERKLEGADQQIVMHRIAELKALLALGLEGIHEGQAEWLGGSA